MSTTTSKIAPVCHCAACNKSIRTSHPQCLQCTKCASSYHALCINISDIRKMSEEAKNNWICPLCKSKAPKSDNSNTPVRAAASVDSQLATAGESSLNAPAPPVLSPGIIPDSDQLGFIASEIKLMREDMKGMKPMRDDLKDLKSQIKFLSEHLKSRLEEVSNKCSELEKRDAAREVELCSLKLTVAELRTQLSYKAQASLKNELEISGITETKGENPMQLARSTAQKIGIGIDHKDIDFAIRMGPRRPINDDANSSTSKLPRPLVIRFVNRHIRDDFLTAAKSRRNLTSSDVGVDGTSRKLYFNERLTQENRQLFRAARQRATEAGYRFCWVKNGSIYARRQEGNASITIKSTEDLELLLLPSGAPKTQPLT